MGFISRTRIVQIARGTSPADPQLIQNPPTLWTSDVGVAVERLSAAMLLVPLVDRPDPSLWWQYVCEWELSTHLIADVLGVIPYQAGALIRTLLVSVDFWATAADRTNGLPPIVRNSFEFQYSRKPHDFGAHVESILYAWMLTASWLSYTGDRRAPTRLALASTNPADDPEGILSNQRLQQIDGSPITILEWRQR